MKTTKPAQWSDDEWKDAIRKIIELGYKKDAHWEAFYACDRWDKYISLPIVLTSSMLSTMSISQTVEPTATMNYLIAIGSLLVTTLSTVNKFYNHAALKEGHRQTCFNYLRLRSELILHINASDALYSTFIETYHRKWLSIRENSPNLPAKIAAEMKRQTDAIENTHLLQYLQPQETCVHVHETENSLPKLV